MSTRYEPHWLWVIGLIVVPLGLLGASVLGLQIGSMVSWSVASVAPRVAVAISVAGICGAAMRRNHIVSAIAALSMAMTLAGYLILRWLGH